MKIEKRKNDGGCKMAETRDRMTNRSTARTFELFVPCWLDATKSLVKEKGFEEGKEQKAEQLKM